MINVALHKQFWIRKIGYGLQRSEARQFDYIDSWETFSTAADNQTQVGVRVLQGEREMASDNKQLGEFELVGIPSTPRGAPQIEVTFDIDANGIVTVSAKDKFTGKEQQITICSSVGLSEDEIQKMVREAEQHAQKDQERTSLIDIKNHDDTQIYSIQKSLAEYRDKILAELVSEIESAVSDLRKEMEGGAPARYRRSSMQPPRRFQRLVSM